MLRGLLGRVIWVEDGERVLNEKAEAQHVGPEGERRVAKGGTVLGDGQCATEQLEHLRESAALELGGLRRMRLEEGDCAQHLSPSLVPGMPDSRHHVLRDESYAQRVGSAVRVTRAVEDSADG